MRLIDFDPRHLRRFDIILSVLVFGMMLCGMMVIWGVRGVEWSKAITAHHQLVMIGMGAVVFLVCCFVDLKTLEWAAWGLYVICIGALAALFFIGHSSGGAQAWLKIGSMTIQPAEFAKIVTVIVLASYLANNRERLEHVSGLIGPALIVAPPFILTILHNDTGTALVFAPVFLVMVFMAGVPKRILVGFFVVFFLATLIALPNLQDYQLKRISHVLGPRLSRPLISVLDRDPEKILADVQDRTGSGWQSYQTRVALGSGQIFGKGWRKGTQTQMRWLPSADKDTVFASLSEQFGMLGCLILAVGYMLIVYRGSRIALNARDMFCSLMVMGLLTIFMVHIIINVGMNVDLLPIIGVPLPFVSYGGSFLIALSIMFGLIVNVGMRKFIY